MNTIIKQKIKEIEENIEIIQENLPPSIEEFKSLGLIKDGIYKKLEFSIQNVVDIFSIIYSSLNLGVPSDLDDIFEKLKVKNIFSVKTIALVQDMKGLRNILIHKYGQVSDSLVYELLSEKISDFEHIIQEVEKYFQARERKK